MRKSLVKMADFGGCFEFVAFSSKGKMMRFEDLYLTSILTSLTVLEVMSFLLIYFG